MNLTGVIVTGDRRCDLRAESREDAEIDRCRLLVGLSAGKLPEEIGHVGRRSGHRGFDRALGAVRSPVRASTKARVVLRPRRPAPSAVTVVVSASALLPVMARLRASRRRASSPSRSGQEQRDSPPAPANAVRKVVGEAAVGTDHRLRGAALRRARKILESAVAVAFLRERRAHSRLRQRACGPDFFGAAEEAGCRLRIAERKRSAAGADPARRSFSGW